MKKRIPRYARLLALTTVVFFAFSACEKDNDKKEPSYVGDWETTRTVSTENGDFDVQDSIHFTKTSFTEVASVQDPLTNEWVNLIGRKGNFTVKSGLMNVTLTEIGFSNVNDSTGIPTGDLVYYQKGTEEYSALLIELEMSETYKAQYSVTGDVLTLKSDNNNNGSFDDADEVYTFTRKD